MTNLMNKRSFIALIGAAALAGCTVSIPDGVIGEPFPEPEQQIFLKKGSFKNGSKVSVVRLEGSGMVTTRISDGFPFKTRKYARTGLNTFESDSGTKVTILSPNSIRFGSGKWIRVVS